mmetsp:Transcript_26041/g.60804  ORF Transcript_26041/g.60804 Transcript_26041/m.60804 type:complete len:100 (+) Transcript_26041:598-897(+)
MTVSARDGDASSIAALNAGCSWTLDARMMRAATSEDFSTAAARRRIEDKGPILSSCTVAGDCSDLSLVPASLTTIQLCVERTARLGGFCEITSPPPAPP